MSVVSPETLKVINQFDLWQRNLHPDIHKLEQQTILAPECQYIGSSQPGAVMTRPHIYAHVRYSVRRENAVHQFRCLLARLLRPYIDENGQICGWLNSCRTEQAAYYGQLYIFEETYA